MAALRALAAIRSRLLTSPQLVAIVGDRIYLGHIFDEVEPEFPLITLRQQSGRLASWAPRLLNPARILIDCYSKKDNFEPSTLDELVESMLHLQKTLTSTSETCFHEIRKLDWNTAFRDEDTGAWRMTSQYLIRVSVS